MKYIQIKKKKYIYFLAFMTVFSSSMYILELYIPKPFPFIKIGLSNVIVLSLVFNYFFKEAVIVSFAKSFIGCFMTGVLFTHAFLLSFSGNLLSCLFMIMLKFFLKNTSDLSCPITQAKNNESEGKVKSSQNGLSIFGLSICGSFIHMGTQLFIVRIFIIQSNSILLLYPLIAVSSILAGFITGLAGYYFNKYMDIRSIYVEACD